MSTPLRSPGGGPPRVRGGEEPDCFCLCFRCVCKRCLTHCWFLFACLGFLFISSLPRISVVIDLVTTVLMYFIDVRKAEGFDSVGELIKRDVTEYNFRTSAFSVVILSVIRTIVLFYCFAYRFHMNDLTFLIATCTTVTSAVYVGIKLVVVDNNSIMPLCIFSFVMILAEYFIYMLVRRQRILGPRSAEEQRLLAGNRAESYQSLPDQHEASVVVQPAPLVEEGLNPEQLADPDSRFILVDRIKVHFKVDGPQKGTPLVLIHGFGGSVFSWKQCWRQLSEHHPVIAFDRPGFGLTSRPVNGDWVENPYTSEYQVGLLFRILDQMNLPQVILIGHSSGGALAMMAALARPERVRAMVLISPTVYTEGFPTLVRSLFRTRLGKELVRQLVRTEIGEVALRRAWHHPSNIPEEVLHHYKQTLKVTAWHEALMEMTNAPPPKFAHRIREIRCPVLVVHGVDDKLVALSESKKVITELAGAPYSHLVSVDECGHVPHEEVPAVFVDHVQEFLREHVLGNDNKDEPDQKE